MALSFSFVLWFSVSALLLFFWFWSIYVVVRQKRAWQFYAEKRKMRYHKNGFLETPSVSGVVDAYSVSLFSSEHGELDGRSQRHLTAIEVILHTSLPVPCAAASGGMVHVAENIGLHKEYKPPTKGWDDSFIIRGEEMDIIREYLSNDRLLKLVNLMKIHKAWIIFLFMGGKGVLRLDTPLPIDNPKEIDVLVKQLINVAKALELTDGEAQSLIRNKKKAENDSPVLDIDEDLLDDHLGFELEEDE